MTTKKTLAHAIADLPAGELEKRFAQIEKHIPQLIVEDRVGILPVNCPANALDGQLEVAGLVGDQPQQVAGVRLIGIDGKNLPVNSLGLRQASAPMMLQGCRDGFCDCFHKNHPGDRSVNSQDDRAAPRPSSSRPTVLTAQGGRGPS